LIVSIQCVVFCHSFGRAQRIEQRLNDDAWPVASIAGGLIQSERLSVTLSILIEFVVNY